jgi:hypothetical protein
MNTKTIGQPSPSGRATCAVVGIVSPNRLFLEPNGSYNPSFEKAALETSKTQFQLTAPTDHEEFDIDFATGVEQLDALQLAAAVEGPSPDHFIVWDGHSRALKFSCPLFERRVRPRQRIFFFFLD